MTPITPATGKATTMNETPQEPWPIANAIASLEEVCDREDGSSDPQRSETIRLAMNYAIEVVKGINTIREPQPPIRWPLPLSTVIAPLAVLVGTLKEYA